MLEDDAELSVRLPEFVREAGSVDADLVRIETTGAPTRVYAAVQTLPGGIAIRPFRSTPMGSAGYVIRAEAAKRIIGHPSLRRRHLDLALYNPFEEPGTAIVTSADGAGFVPAAWCQG